MVSKLKARDPKEVTAKHSKLLIFGGPKCGKTWFGLSFPKPFYIDTEDGAILAHYQRRLAESGGRYLGKEDGACDFDTICDQLQALATEKHEYKTLVLDSITKVFQTRIARDAERLGEKDAFGASKKPAIGQCRRILSWLPKLNMNVVFIAHDMKDWGESGGQRKVLGVVPDVWDKFPFELDLTLYATKLGSGVRRVQVRDSRLRGFKDFDEFYLQENGNDVGYKNFAERYGKDFLEAAAVPVTLATVEQVTEIDRLVLLLKTEPEEIEKLLSKAGAEKWSEITTDQAAKTIEWFKKKIEGVKS